jgi:hypothetical protein
MSEPNKSPGDDDKPVVTKRQARIFGGALITLWLAVPFLGWLFSKPADAGTFGDSFGSVNALFTGLAFGGLIYTILLQRKELELQRQELKNNVAALNLQAEELKRSATAQAEIAKIQLTTARIDALATANVILRDRISNEARHLELVSAQLQGAMNHCTLDQRDPDADPSYIQWRDRHMKSVVTISAYERELRLNDDAVLEMTRGFSATPA